MVEVLLEVDALLVPAVASPAHGDLVEVFEQRHEPDEVSVLQKLLLHEVEWYLDVLEAAPLEEPLLLLEQRLLDQKLPDLVVLLLLCRCISQLKGRNCPAAPCTVTFLPIKTVSPGREHVWLLESDRATFHSYLAEAVRRLL